MIISDENIKKLKPYIKNLDEILEKNDRRTMIDTLDDLFLYYLQPDDEPSELSLMFEKIRDQFYYDNFIR